VKANKNYMRDKSKESNFTELVRDNHDIIRRIAGYYSDDSHEQEDLYQEIISQLWQSFDNFKENAAFSTWLYRVATNTAISHLRKSKTQPKWNFWQGNKDEPASSMEKDPLVEAEEKQILRNQIKQLDQMDQTLILLYLEEVEYQTIAEITGLSKSNVGVRLHRIREQLKNMIQKNLGRHGS